MADEKQTTPPAADSAKAPAPDAKKTEGDKAENKEAPAASAKPVSAGSPWLPVLVVMIILPVISFLMTEYVMLPRVKKALGEIARIQQEGDQPAHGGPLPSEKKETAKSGHGSAKEGKEGGAVETPGVKFDNIVANLAGSMKSRFLKVSFAIEGDDESFNEIIENNRTKIIDSALGILGSLTVAELDEPGTKNIVRSDLIDGFNQVLEKPIVKRLYFSEFVIQ